MLSSLRSRIFAMYSLLFLLIMLVAVALLNIYFTRNASRQTVAGLDVLAGNVSGQVRSTFDQMNRISIQVHFSQNILHIMKSTHSTQDSRNYFDHNPESAFVMQKDFLTILGMDITDIIITLYNPDAFITTAQSSVDWPTITREAESGLVCQINQTLDKTPFEAVLAGPHNLYWTDGASSSQEYFSLSRRLYDSPIAKSLGVVQVLVSRNKIEELCYSTDDSIHIFLFQHSGGILNASEKGPVSSDAVELLYAGKDLPQNRHYIGSSGKRYYVSRHMVPGSPYGVLIMQENQNSGLVLYLGTALAVTLTLLLMAVTLNLLISRYLTRPLDQIIAALQQVTHSHLDMDINFNSSCDDLKQLQQFYNEMLARVRESMNMAFQSKLNEREAYYLALQSQISPHFLYNCIGNINAIAYEHDVPAIMAICERMSDMLRYSSNFQRDHSTIEQELAYTRNYLDLMQIRYSGEFIFSEDSDSFCDQCVIPRLMLQTIVENCFKHGFSNVRLRKNTA